MNARRLGVAALFLAAMLSIGSGRFSNWNLPVSYAWYGGCAIGVGRDATLHGSPGDPAVTWATDNLSGQRFELLWPVGYRAEFDGGLELYDTRGQLIGHEGDLIIGSCLTVPGDARVRVDAHDIRSPTWQSGDG